MSNSGEVVEKWSLIYWQWACKVVQSLWKTVGKSFLKNQICNYHMTQRFLSWASIPQKGELTLTRKPAHNCSEQLYSKWPHTESNADARQRVNG